MKGQKKQQVRQQSESIEDIRRREYIERIIPEDIPLSDPIGIIGEAFGQGYKDGFRDGAYWMLCLANSPFGDEQSEQETTHESKDGKRRQEMRLSDFDKLESLVGKYARYQTQRSENMSYIYIVTFVRPRGNERMRKYTSVYGLAYSFHEDRNHFNSLLSRGIIYLDQMEVDSMKEITRKEFEDEFHSGSKSLLHFNQFYNKALADCITINGSN